MNDPRYRPIEFLFFDTSALLKLVFHKEPGSKTACQLATDCAPGFTSWVLVGEALCVLKNKWRQDNWTDDVYTATVFLLLTRIESDFKIVDLATRDSRPVLEINQGEILDIQVRHPKLDAADALQLALIRRGISGLVSGAKLVSADKRLLRAAQEDGIETIPVNRDSTRRAG